MTDREPSDKELQDAQADVEGHGIDEEDQGEAAVYDINFGCNAD